MEAAFANAAGRAGGPIIDSRRLAGRTARFTFGGDGLRSVVLRALAHLAPASDGVAADLEVSCWDSADTGVALPQPLWNWPAASEPMRIVLPAGARSFRLFVTPNRDGLILFDVERRKAVFWSSDARRLPSHWHGSPLLSLFHWWSATQGLHLLHAGCVGGDAGGVLLVGRGGSGKSTTALLALLAGLRYVSDDYCLLQTGSPPIAHSLYGTGKLHRDHLVRFPPLAAHAVDPMPDEFGKPIVFVREHFPDQIAERMPLRTVVLPRTAAAPRTRLQRISGSEALRGFAPSTLFQLPELHARTFPAMAALVRDLPCFRLDVGTDWEAVAPSLRALIEDLP
jgi:hypothetical protein